MPKLLAEARTRVDFLDVAPVNPGAATLAELNAGVPLSCAIVASGFVLGPTDSDRITGEKSLCDEGNVSSMGPSNYAAAMSFFRYLTAAGASEAGQDVAYETFTGKGIGGYLVKRMGPKATAPWAATQVYSLYEVVSDNPQDPEDTAGYMKYRQPFEVGGLVVLRGVVAAA